MADNEGMDENPEGSYFSNNGCDRLLRAVVNCSKLVQKMAILLPVHFLNMYTLLHKEKSAQHSIAQHKETIYQMQKCAVHRYKEDGKDDENE